MIKLILLFLFCCRNNGLVHEALQKSVKNVYPTFPEPKVSVKIFNLL